MITTTVRNLFEGLKLAFLLPVRLQSFRPTLTGSFLLLGIGVAALAAFSYPREQGEIYFNDMGAAFLAAAILASVVLSIVVTRSQGSLDRLPEILTLLFSAFPWVVVVLSGLRLILDPAADNGSHWGMALLWCVAVVVRSVQLTFNRISTLALLGTAVVTAGLAFGASHRGHSPVLFYAYDSSDYEQFANLDQEEVFFSQSNLLNEKLQQIAPNRPDETDVYFIGFAGNGDESVFASEASFVQERVAEKFSTDGRSLVLASSFERIDSEPIANTHNLFRSISDVGDKMDAEEDVLFLFLTSHGSKNATVDVSLFPLRLKPLRADDLRAALDAAGIEWRIIVVSACYSGSFIESLKTDRTIVMTASAAEKTSFGCSRDRDLTYFGEALFQDSFGNGSDLVETFEQAKASIGEREEREGLSTSDPQIYVGSEIEQKMAQLLAK